MKSSIIIPFLFFFINAFAQSTTSEEINIDVETMIFVQGGTFTMGCTDEQVRYCENDENPPHQVTVSSFYIGKYEVTQEQWRAIMGNSPAHFRGSNLPVENVSLREIKKFIRKLNKKTGKKYRLPTEAEWEFAARGGIHSKGYLFSGSNNIDNVAWYDKNSNHKTHTVGTKAPNELGIYDMNGNVFELCSNRIFDYSHRPPQYERRSKGGCWNFVPYIRGFLITSHFRDGRFGFRLALDCF